MISKIIKMALAWMLIIPAFMTAISMCFNTAHDYITTYSGSCWLIVVLGFGLIAVGATCMVLAIVSLTFVTYHIVKGKHEPIQS